MYFRTTVTLGIAALVLLAGCKSVALKYDIDKKQLEKEIADCQANPTDDCRNEFLRDAKEPGRARPSNEQGQTEGVGLLPNRTSRPSLLPHLQLPANHAKPRIQSSRRHPNRSLRGDLRARG